MTVSLEGTIKAWDGESVVVAFDDATGAWIFIAMHDTRLGPASGGTRLKTYPEPVDGLIDAQRLAAGMTYKWAGVGMPFGGGKAVIATTSDLDAEARQGLLDRYAHRLVALNGAFQTGVDLGTTPEDMGRIGALSGHAVGVVDGQPADPGPYTAAGVFVGIRAALGHRFSDPSFEGRRILIQGVGDVGLPLAEQLHAAGANLVVSDLDPAAVHTSVERFGAEVVEPDAVYESEVDVYAPCAVGATLNPDSIPRLRCEIVAGSANNQLLTPSDGDALHARGILYAPDYVINAGGAVAFGHIHLGERAEERLHAEVAKIEPSLEQIFAEAAANDESPHWAAQRRADRVLSEHG